VKTHARKLSTRHRARETASLACLVALAGLCLFGATGCGGFFYAIYAGGASSKLETAQQLGAEKYAPYEYYYAQEHLLKAMEEAATADYGDAIDLADEADKSATKAILLSKQAHEGAGR
jgi:Domain of unknown function (DUF4398)